jgi:short-subunit dehydrogenase
LNIVNKLIVITGATQGIGRAIAEKFAAEGFDVVACARKAEGLLALKEELEKKHGVHVQVQPVDMAKRDAVEKFAAFILSLGRTVDVLVNNAGYFVPGALTEEPDGTLESMIEANVYSAYYMTRGLAGSMKTRKGGHIFNMCSIASIKAYPNGGSYAIAKFALLGFSKCLREELKPFGIRVTAILPGATRTASWDGTTLPDERFMPPHDIADTVFAAYTLSERTVVEEIVLRPQMGDI